jgi:hypothetical protein
MLINGQFQTMSMIIKAMFLFASTSLDLAI